MDLETYSTFGGITTIQLNPASYPHATLKAFNESIKQSESRHVAQYPVLMKNAIDTEIEKWLSNDSNTKNKELTTEILKARWLE